MNDSYHQKTSDRAHRESPATEAAENASLTAKLVEVLDRYLADVNDGKSPSRTQLLKQHPELAGQLDACLAGIDFIQGASDTSKEQDALPQLADFRIVREVGRGGMGVVYEARQTSLDRRVALKVLRFGAVSDPAALERFKREAETVANLHHTNIVPIYSFGSEDGVNFYAMEFIEGRSLDIVFNAAAQPLDLEEVVLWGLQAAEALSHAHQRKIIHRDVKPSNLIVDREGRLWLTDFGLAKRLDDVTLSLTGALLGTPRYMSPEQAATTSQEIDHRSDLYSLGATLYELLTGQPVVDGDSHHAVIGKILEEEPIAPRLIRQDLPRDLETIVLKCLSKEPGKRYQTADELAEDLRAYLHQRPISARRPNLAERSIRWLQRNRASVSKTAATMTATAVVVLGCLFGWRSYQNSLLVPLTMQSEEALIAKIEDPSGTERVITLPTQEPLQVPAGDLRMRVIGNSRPSHDYRTEISPGSTPRYQLVSDANEMDNTADLTGQYRFVSFRDGVDAIVHSDGTIRRIDAVNGEALWQKNLLELFGETSSRPEVASRQAGVMKLVFADGSRFSPGNRPAAEQTIVGTVDLNTDGEGDVVLAVQNQSTLLAISGKDGTKLWTSDRDAIIDASENSSEKWDDFVSTHFSINHSVGDLNEDGIADLLATFGYFRNSIFKAAAEDASVGSDQTQHVLAAFSGSDGKLIWRTDLPADGFQLKPGQSIPNAFSWFPLGKGNLVQSGSLGRIRKGSVTFRSVRYRYQNDGMRLFAPDRPQLITSSDVSPIESRGANTGIIGMLAGTRLIAINPNNGMVVSSVDTQAVAIRPAIWSDLDGDAIADAVLLEQIPNGQLRCSAWSVTAEKKLWEKAVSASFSTVPGDLYQTPAWPVVVDLDGDGRAEVVLPTDSSDGVNKPQSHVPWGEISVLGSNGQPVWSYRVLNMDQQMDHFTVGPDLNGDGIREVFAAALWGDQFDLYLNALSGADGEPMWWNRYAMPVDRTASPDYFLGPLAWWQQDPGGIPQLIAHAHDENSDGPTRFVAVSGASGKLVHEVTDVDQVIPADVDGKTFEDLLVVRDLEPGYVSGPKRQLRAFKGTGERWRRLGGPRWSLVADLNGDGIRDLINRSDSSGFHAISGSNGDVLWKVSDAGYNQATIKSVASLERMEDSENSKGRDLNGDGIADLLAWERTGAASRSTQPIYAISGKTGTRLWSAGIRVNVLHAVPCLDIRDLDGDGDPEVIVVAAMDWGYGRRRGYGTGDQQLWLAVLAGQSGRVIWKEPLSVAYGIATGGRNLPYRFENLDILCSYVDLNDDGVLDLVVPAETKKDSGEYELRARNGKTGMPLWNLHLPKVNPEKPFRSISNITLADLDQDGKPELLVSGAVAASNGAAPGRRPVQLFAVNRDGHVRWQRKMSAPGIFQRYRDEALDRRGPVVIQQSQANPLVCLPFTAAKGLVVLDATGEERFERLANSTNGERVWAADADGDGTHELILVSERRLSAIQIQPTQKELWHIDVDRFDPTFGERSSLTVSGFQNGSDKHPPCMLIRAGPHQNSIFAIDLRSGEVKWEGRGPQPKNRFGNIRIESIEPLTANAGERPIVYFHFGHESQCHDAIFSGVVDAANKSQAISGLAANVLQPPADDPRLQRELPWQPFIADAVQAMSGYWFWGLVYCFSLIVLPAVYLLSLWYRRRWGLRTIALMPVVAAIFILGSAFDLHGPFEMTTMQRFLIAFVFLPVVVFLAVVSYLVALRRWRWLVSLAATAVALSIVSSTIVLWIQVGSAVWLPGEHYSWTGWYWIVVGAIYLIGVAMIGSVPVLVRNCFAMQSGHSSRRQQQMSSSAVASP